MYGGDYSYGEDINTVVLTSSQANTLTVQLYDTNNTFEIIGTAAEEYTEYLCEGPENNSEYLILYPDGTFEYGCYWYIENETTGEPEEEQEIRYRGRYYEAEVDEEGVYDLWVTENVINPDMEIPQDGDYLDTVRT